MTFDIDKFIQCVQNNNSIWEVVSKEYKDRNLKWKGWMNVGSSMYEDWNELGNADKEERGLEIWPNTSSFILTSDTSESKRALLCAGNEPIQWYYKQNDGTLMMKKNYSVKVFRTDKNRVTYLSLLSLSTVNFLDTGYYICSSSIELKYYKDIYVFVHHAAHLLAIPEDFKLLYDLTKYDTVNGPFRSTSPDVDVKITTDTNSFYKVTCNSLDFRCSNGQCIGHSSVCNGKKDCTDGSDEDKFMCKMRTCSPESQFKCSNGLCVDNFWLCDGKNDCQDGADENELMCNARSCSPQRPFKCNNGRCIHNTQVCDGKIHCKDGRDEDELMCKARLCDPDQFKCNNGKCIPNNWVCNIDDSKDCHDGIDEDELMCKARPCSSDRPFKCENGKCIYISQVCNGQKDCNTGNDEDELMCKAKSCKPESQFKCNNGQCIWNVQVCNGLKNCNDSSDEDELMCKAKTCDPGRPFKCKNGIQCILNSRVCDGMVKDCKDSSDEDELMCKVTRYVQFDYKKGFQMHASIFLELNIPIVCTASKNNMIEHRLIPNPWESWIHIDDSSSGHVIIHHNLTLKCSLEPNISFIYTLKWLVPGISENGTEHSRFGIGEYINGTVLLNIQNVSTSDEGDYFCIAKANNGQNYTKKYILRTFRKSPYNVNYFNLRIDDGVNKKIRPTGHERVQWTIQVSAIQNISLKWIRPNGNKLETKSKKECTKSNNCSSELIIMNIRPSDSGVYTLSAYNGVESKEIKTLLLVEEKPTVSLIKRLDSTLPYYEIGKYYTFEFYISGYPLPNVEWNFKKCLNYPKCGHSDTKTKNIKNETIQLSEMTLKLVIIINITETGALTCNASNILGHFIKQFTVLVMDASDDLEIKGSPIIIPGDSVKIQCGVSIYNYHNDITWNYPQDNSNHSNFNIIHIKTNLSYLSYLMIKNISKAFNGYLLNCTVKPIIQQNYVLPETETKSLVIKVEDPRVPVINNSSNTSTLIVVYHGKQLNLSCFATGVPPPIISWFKDDQPLLYNGNDSRVLIQSENQLLTVRFNETDNDTTYKCNASNRIGSAVLTYTLTLNYKRHKSGSSRFLVSFIVLIVYLGILFKCFSMYLEGKKTMKKTLALIDMYKSENDALKCDYPNFRTELQKYVLHQQLNFPADKLKLGKRLGSGAFGIVFKGKAVGIVDENITTTVAVKTVNSSFDQSSFNALESELKMMINIGNHLNIVNMLGMCTDTIEKKLMMIVEYCRFGSVHQYMLKYRNCFINQLAQVGFIDCDTKLLKSENPIYENFPSDVTKSKISKDTRIGFFGSSDDCEILSQEPINNNHGNNKQQNNIKRLCTHDLISWSFQVARGMEYLASKKVLHGDLATRNILLTEENIVKICDFGLSKSLHYSEIYKKRSKKDLLPVKWMAIESIRDLVFSTQSDVWSFGIVLWEIFSLASTPYPDIQLYELYNKLINGYRLEQPKYANSQLYNIMLHCWETEPSKRPFFTDLTDHLGDILQDFSKSNYVNLNDNYVKAVHETLPSTDSTFCVTTLTYSNFSIAANNNNESSINTSADCSLDKNVNEIIPMDNDT